MSETDSEIFYDKSNAKKKKKKKKISDVNKENIVPQAAAKKVPGPKKTAGATARAGKHKKSETESESERQVKKKAKYPDSDSDFASQ